MLISSGCSIKQVQAALGHESAKVTLDIYAHLFPGDEDRVRDAIDRRIGSQHGVSGTGDLANLKLVPAVARER